MSAAHTQERCSRSGAANAQQSRTSADHVESAGLSWAQAARRAGVGLTTLKGLVRRGDCPPPRCVSPRRRVFMNDEFEAWLKSRPTPTQGDRRQRRRAT